MNPSGIFTQGCCRLVVRYLYDYKFSIFTPQVKTWEYRNMLFKFIVKQCITTDTFNTARNNVAHKPDITVVIVLGHIAMIVDIAVLHDVYIVLIFH